MKKIKLLIGAILLLAFTCEAQSDMSYGQIEHRFTKKRLNHDDSLAFKMLSIQKADQLVEYARFYIVEDINADTKEHVRSKALEMFRENTQTGLIMELDMDGILTELAQNTVHQDSSAVEFIIEHETFGRIKILTFEAEVVLIRAKKQFGSEEQKVWQVFFTNPRFLK